MTVAEFALYLFSVVLIFSAAAVVFSKSAVHSVLFLILAFFNTAGLFILIGAEFLAMVIVIVYVGAVATLFLFVVMMLDVDRIQKREGLAQSLPAGIVTGVVLLGELIFVGSSWGDVATSMEFANDVGDLPMSEGVGNTQAIGAVLYTDYFLLFQLSGLILLVAMIGAIVLTLVPGPKVRTQNIPTQNARSPEDSIELHSPKPGEGV